MTTTTRSPCRVDALSTSNGNLFDQKLEEHHLGELRARSVDTLQVNIGKLCNQACRHCHVDAGPHQTGAEVNMNAEMVDRVIAILEGGAIRTVDITGGAPELNPNFRYLVTEARVRGLTVIDRCNLTVLLLEGQEDTFLPSRITSFGTLAEAQPHCLHHLYVG